MSTEIVLVKSENISKLLVDAPEMYALNKESHDKCITRGEEYLSIIDASGMNDELDQKIALYLTKCRNTVKVLNERRTPVTKMIDEIRSAFTDRKSVV